MSHEVDIRSLGHPLADSNVEIFAHTREVSESQCALRGVVAAGSRNPPCLLSQARNRRTIRRWACILLMQKCEIRS